MTTMAMSTYSLGMSLGIMLAVLVVLAVTENWHAWRYHGRHGINRHHQSWIPPGRHRPAEDRWWMMNWREYPDLVELAGA